MEKVIKTINELCVKITDGAHNSPVECLEGSYKMYSSKDMTYNSFDDSNVKLISLEDYQKLVNQDCQPHKNDILIIKDGANYLKYVFKVQETIEAVILSSIAILRPNQIIINPDYFVYLLRTASIRNAMSNYVSGAAIPRIVLKDFKKMKLDIVSNLSVQKSISSALLLFDNLIEVNNKRIKALEQIAENLYKEWFVRFRFPGHETAEFENGIPKGWSISKLENVLSLRDNDRIPLSSLERESMQKKYPYYGAASILDYVDDYLFDGVYLLLGEDGTVIDENGYPSLQYVWGKFWVNNHAHVIEKISFFSVEFLYCMFKRMNIQSIVTGAAQPKISKGRLLNKRILLPCEKTIISFDEMIQPIFNEIRKLSNANQNLIKQRDLLLPRLMSGKLEV